MSNLAMYFNASTTNVEVYYTCARGGCRFQISGTAGPIVLRFDTPIATGWQGAVQKSVGNTPTQFRTCRAHPFARSRIAPKGVLLVH